MRTSTSTNLKTSSPLPDFVHINKDEGVLAVHAQNISIFACNRDPVWPLADKRGRISPGNPAESDAVSVREARAILQISIALRFSARAHVVTSTGMTSHAL